MKRIEPFRLGAEIPSNATFVYAREEAEDILFFYEVAIKSKKTPKSKEEDIEQNDIIERILNYLNRKTNGKYTIKNKATSKDIKARLAEDVDPQDFKKVIDNMCGTWLGGEMAMYLRPSTLFGNKFYDYLKVGNSESDRDAAFAALEQLNQKVIEDEKRTV